MTRRLTCESERTSATRAFETKSRQRREGFVLMPMTSSHLYADIFQKSHNGVPDPRYSTNFITPNTSSAGASDHQPENNTLPRPTLNKLPQEMRLLIWKQVFEGTVVKVDVQLNARTNASIVHALYPHASLSPHLLC